MQRLSLWLVTAIAVLALSGAGFTKKPAPAAHPAPTSPAVASAKAGHPAAKTFDTNEYYFYSAFDGSYNDYETTAYEIWEMEIYYDCTVNTDPAGGTLIEKGYYPNNPGLPALVFLYGHFID